MSQEVKIISAYIVLFLFFFAAFILLGLIIHLIYVAHRKIKNTSRSNRCNNKAILVIIIVTLIGIISFFISVLLLIATVIQLLIIDGHKLDQKSHYSFESIEYLTVIFDEFGHLSMLTVFVIRLKICFEASVYGFSKVFMRFMYCCLILLMVGSFGIIMQMTNDSNIEVIIISEIIWELSTEAMMLWILYLFVSKLQSLVKMGLGRSRRNLRLTISYNISQKSGSRDNSMRSPSPSPSPRTPRSPSNKPNQNVLNTQNLVNVMTKMTLLVLIAVFASIFSMIANIYIEIIQLQSVEPNVANIGSIWPHLLPVFDMVLASFMLYLQFDFTKNVYNKICSKWDILFIQFCGDLLSKRTANEEKTVPSTTNNVPSIKRLTVDITAVTTETNHGPFTPPSPSPTPIAQSIRNNTAIQIKRPTPITPKTPTMQQNISSGKINTSFWENAIANSCPSPKA